LPTLSSFWAVQLEQYLQANSKFIVDSYKFAGCDTVLLCPSLKPPHWSMN
jgi:hypothetical protein